MEKLQSRFPRILLREIQTEAFLNPIPIRAFSCLFHTVFVEAKNNNLILWCEMSVLHQRVHLDRYLGLKTQPPYDLMQKWLLQFILFFCLHSASLNSFGITICLEFLSHKRGSFGYYEQKNNLKIAILASGICCFVLIEGFTRATTQQSINQSILI